MRSSDLRRDVGQLLIMGFTGVEATSTLRALLRTLAPGGIILFARNITGAEQTHEFLAECQEVLDTPLFRCVDLEGGTVDRLRNVVAHAPAAAEVFATGDPRLFRRHGRVIGEEVRALGFNVDFAPTLDLAFPASRNVLTTRVVSSRPEAVAGYARQFLGGLADARVLGCGKHFPGLGEAALDTHKELPAVAKPWDALWREDLAPYRELRRELPFVMVAHAAYPKVTRDRRPASLSKKWMTDILRKKIGYDGLIVSDDLEMGGVLAASSIGEAAVETLRAGADMFLVCHNEEAVQQTWDAVLTAAERDRKLARHIAQSARRVRQAKRKWKLSARLPAPPSERTVEKLRWSVLEFRRACEAAAAQRL
ncbi:MAG TPA: beta-N-acetylhexosaminidase [Terriglobales bacterium]|nr:beta-N-acetylhexosaminidase [Terriglobales bacterium]